ncbi:hypothetical protein PCASD_20434 [Puccinia coronata f. sp. avenae]|uniref:Uncharacterized protein n=1 Tax=Puccinia coronata f. sp. avenae TaxID=200324 RepID=A0A2N5TQP7_9BASI|nr:hypothetical protein PCASD_20434 [Puccinia coronata f. sp. avenae]
MVHADKEDGRDGEKHHFLIVAPLPSAAPLLTSFKPGVERVSQVPIEMTSQHVPIDTTSQRHNLIQIALTLRFFCNGFLEGSFVRDRPSTQPRRVRVEEFEFSIIVCDLDPLERARLKGCARTGSPSKSRAGWRRSQAEQLAKLGKKPYPLRQKYALALRRSKIRIFSARCRIGRWLPTKELSASQTDVLPDPASPTNRTALVATKLLAFSSSGTLGQQHVTVFSSFLMAQCAFTTPSK